MTSDKVDAFIRKLAGLIEPFGAAEAKSLVALADGLKPFGGLTVPQFAEFLGKADAFARGDLASVFPKPKPKPKPKKAVVVDPDRVGTAVGKLKDLHARALDPNVTPESVQAAVKVFEKYTVDEVAQIAVGCGFSQKFPNRPATWKAISGWIIGRKNTKDRAEV